MQTHRAVKAVRRAAQYYTYRDGPDRAQRTWSTSDGADQVAYADVQAAIHADAQAYRYTYRVVVSTKDAALAPAEYRQVLANRFERYYFIAHHNTDYPHAHVIGFRQQRIQKAELQAMRGTALDAEQARTQERAQSAHAQRPDAGKEPMHQLRQDRTHDQGIG